MLLTLDQNVTGVMSLLLLRKYVNDIVLLWSDAECTETHAAK